MCRLRAQRGMRWTVLTRNPWFGTGETLREKQGAEERHIWGHIQNRERVR